MNELYARAQFAKIDCAASGSNAIVAAVTGKKIRVIAYTIVVSGAVTVTWLSAATALSGAKSYPANGGASPSSPYGVLQTAAGEALNVSLGGAVQVSGHLTYILE